MSEDVCLAVFFGTEPRENGMGMLQKIAGEKISHQRGTWKCISS